MDIEKVARSNGILSVTVCEADSTTCTELDSTVCYDETDQSDSENDSLSSGPMFIEDTDEEDTHHTDNELPHIERGHVEGQGPILPAITPGAVAAAPASAAPYLDSDSDKCNCTEDSKDKVSFFLSFYFIHTLKSKLKDLF